MLPVIVHHWQTDLLMLLQAVYDGACLNIVFHAFPSFAAVVQSFDQFQGGTLNIQGERN